MWWRHGLACRHGAAAGACRGQMSGGQPSLGWQLAAAEGKDDLTQHDCSGVKDATLTGLVSVCAGTLSSPR